MNRKDYQLSLLVDEESPEAVLSAVRLIFLDSYSTKAFKTVDFLFKKIEDLFAGRFIGYLGCNTEYHDLTHTLTVFMAAARLMDGRNLSESPFSEAKAVSILCAALLHDTGYLQESDDLSGTGAKYTKEHVDRSRRFAVIQKDRLQLPDELVSFISYLIACTELQTDCREIFHSEEDRIAGSILGSADLVGQMGDRAYLEKLLFLYYEFKEAGFPGYNTEFDILKNTLAFYDSTRERLETTLMKSYRFADTHFLHRHNIPENLYMKSIERQMSYLKTILEDRKGNFRNKLNRIDLDKRESSIIAS